MVLTSIEGYTIIFHARTGGKGVRWAASPQAENVDRSATPWPTAQSREKSAAARSPDLPPAIVLIGPASLGIGTTSSLVPGDQRPGQAKGRHYVMPGPIDRRKPFDP